MAWCPRLTPMLQQLFDKIGLHPRGEPQEGDFVVEYPIFQKCLPFVGVVIFGFAGCYALRDPDPSDQFAGVLILLVSLLFDLILLHRITLRLWYRDGEVRSASILFKQRGVDLFTQFDTKWGDSFESVKLRQGASKISANYRMVGYQGLANLIRKEQDWDLNP